MRPMNRMITVYKIAPGLTNSIALIMLYILVLLNIFGLSLSASAESIEIDGVVNSESIRDELANALDSIRLENGIAAFGLVVIEDDQLAILTTRGVANRASGEPISDDSIFRIGSISKLFTGLIAAQLSADDMLDLAAPVKSWPVADTYSNPWTDQHPITVAQLLEHTAGFTDLSKPEWDYSDPQQLPLSKTLRMYPEARRSTWPPGRHYSYSNAGAGLAAYVMELETDKPYEELLQEIVLDPLVMNSTTALPPANDKLALGYDTDGTTPIPYWHQIFRPFGAINSSLKDMANLLRVLLNKGTLDGRRLYAEAVITRVETPTTSLASRNGLQYGYGLGNYNWFREGIEFHGHGGDADGYLSRLGYSRTTKSGYFMVITAFQPATLKKMTALVETYLIRNTNSEKPETELAITDKEIASITGDYQRVTRRFAASKTNRNDEVLRVFPDQSNSLYYKHGKQSAKRILPVARYQFRHESDVAATFFIGPDEDGVIYFQKGSDNFRRMATMETAEE